MKKINIAILGFGTIGKGVFDLIYKNNTHYKKKYGLDLNVKKILVRKENPKKDKRIKSSIWCFDFKKIINDKSIDVIVEVIGGDTLATDYVLEALNKKKHVVTANKAMLCPNYKKIMTLSKKKNVSFRYEASVLGGVPVINALEKAIASNKVESIFGILNGTANYILTKMTYENMSFDTALKKAQDLGFAESDPTDDVKGIDTANKLSILINLICGKYVSVKELKATGIDKLKSAEIKKAKRKNMVYKLLGKASFKNNKVTYSIKPTLVDKNNLLYNINNEDNAILIKGDGLGDILLAGKGAGALPTASSVVSDIINIYDK